MREFFFRLRRALWFLLRGPNRAAKVKKSRNIADDIYPGITDEEDQRFPGRYDP